MGWTRGWRLLACCQRTWIHCSFLSVVEYGSYRAPDSPSPSLDLTSNSLSSQFVIIESVLVISSALLMGLSGLFLNTDMTARLIVTQITVTLEFLVVVRMNPSFLLI